MKMSQLTLVLDSSTPVLFFALAKDEQYLASWHATLDRTQSELMVPRLVSFLKEYGYQLQDVHHVIVGVGPGSFTGVRLALTLAKMLAALSPIQVYPVSSLHLLAIAPISLVSLDARGQRRYLGIYQGRDVLLADTIVSEAAYQKMKPTYPNGVEVTIDIAMHDPKAIVIQAIALAHQCGAIQDYHQLKPMYLKDLL
jgi:tRNA threonylcarbamoyl adenosine modification protein YeaZ